MEDMGMTNGQFKSLVRFIMDDLEEVRKEKDEEKQKAKIDKVLEILQSSLED